MPNDIIIWSSNRDSVMFCMATPHVLNLAENKLLDMFVFPLNVRV